MSISEEHLKAAAVCIACRIPFGLILPPGEPVSRFYATLADGEAALTVDSTRFRPGFFATFFGDSPSDAVYIPADLTADDILDPSFASTYTDMPEAETVAADTPTDFMKYCSALRTLIGTLKKSRGKTVISRLIPVLSSTGPLDVFAKYADAVADNTFRFIFYTPSTGMWIGASPELLLSHEYGSGKFSTMSLAGTRGRTDGEWDHKNRVEHDYVTDYIDFHFRNHNLTVDIQSAAPVAFGRIEHICEVITGTGDTDPVGLLDDLNPTPALCGFPVAESFENILSYEMHDRKCYGGMVGIADENGFAAYVNLRSCLVSPAKDDSFLYNIYAGGGITGDSDPLEEWNEAAAKAAMLFNAVNDKNRLMGDQPTRLSFESYDDAYTSSIR